MARVHFKVLSGQPEVREALLICRGAAPAGYTPIIYLTEWLTLNCRSDWASKARGAKVTVLFASERDHARALARFPA